VTTVPTAAAPAPALAQAAQELKTLFGEAGFELRFSLHGRSAVRVWGDGPPVARRHAEATDPQAPWSTRAAAGHAVGWLLADGAPAQQAAAHELLQRAVERHTALALEAQAARRAAVMAEALEVLTHRLRTDVSTLQAVAEGALAGAFEPDESDAVIHEVQGVGAEAQRRLSDARELMTVLAAHGEDRQEPLVEVLRAELEGTGVSAPVASVDGEDPMALVPGAGWAAIARRIAAVLAEDGRLRGDGARVAVLPDPEGWRVTAGGAGPVLREAAWTRQTVGPLVHAGELAVAAGGWASAAELEGDGLRVALTVPAAPSR
jgi:hypothetical protein